MKPETRAELDRIEAKLERISKAGLNLPLGHRSTNEAIQRLTRRVEALERPAIPAGAMTGYEHYTSRDLLTWYGTELSIDTRDGTNRPITAGMYTELLRRLEK